MHSITLPLLGQVSTEFFPEDYAFGVGKTHKGNPHRKPFCKPTSRTERSAWFSWEWRRSQYPIQLLNLANVTPNALGARSCRLASVGIGRLFDHGGWFDKPLQDAVQLIEQIVNGRADESAMWDLWQRIRRSHKKSIPSVKLATAILNPHAQQALRRAVKFGCRHGVESTTQQAILSLMRDVFGNPFQPVPFEPRWLTSDVVGLARTIDSEHAWALMPILSDALMDASCDEAEILDHCRAKHHCRGCWLIELILGTGRAVLS